MGSRGMRRRSAGADFSRSCIKLMHPPIMTPTEQVLSRAALIEVLVFMIAFIAAPHSCEWGLEIFVLTGLVSFLGLFALPFVSFVDKSRAKQIAWGIGLAVCGVVGWFGALLLANVRILCRLF